ncbi:PP2C family protein-serine/threonine phosphatase [Terracidiphilus gabretensis]|uniref:PP2C family protein-serine/threonine phosphatase n=1 Tax=Terracidiphilus gabretensis TaxID=1577687 RepID=UPI00071BB24F|nr:SpoIIE family protein phosphatase [Terracidiphilus gabretensis]
MKQKPLLNLCLLAVALLGLCGSRAAETQAPPDSPPPPAHSRSHSGPQEQHSASKKSANTDSDESILLDATHIGAPVMLTKGWRVGVTGDEAAASDFDDSNWAVRDAAESIADVDDDSDSDKNNDNGLRRHGPHDFVWFRLHLKLAPNHGPLALLIEVPVKGSASLSGVGTLSSDAVVFANGQEIRPDGPNNATPERYQSISRLYHLQVPPGETGLTLAVRTFHIPFGLTAYTRFFAARTLMLGSPESLTRSVELWRDHSLFERLPKVVNSILLVVLAGFLFALYFTQKGHREYLWLGLYELVQAPISLIDMAGSFAYMETLLYAAIFLQLVAISAYLYFEFLVAFLDLSHRWTGKFKRWFIYALRFTAPVLLGVGPLLLFVEHGRFVGVLLGFDMVASAFWMLLWLVFCLVVLIAATARRNYEAGLLLIPLLLSFVGLIEPIFTSGMMDTNGHPYHSPLTVYAGPVPIHFASIADFVGLLTIVLIIFGRFLRIHHVQERASSELAAARSVQELMIPQEKVKTPGFEVESVYNPAAEVGGDFFHIENTPDGGMLIVIGDVAGKGLKAAMNVSMLVGALRGVDVHSPAKVLQSLNRAMVGSDSFTTCQAAWFGPNGELVMANAGHLPPYLNSQEIAIPGGLPVGVLADVTYDEIRLFLHPGDRVLFLSDGVVEARQPSGELFGFDRVHNLSNQSAFYIADAAKEFGQEDDITVLTVRRLAPAAVAA